MTRIASDATPSFHSRYRPAYRMSSLVRHDGVIHLVRHDGVINGLPVPPQYA